MESGGRGYRNQECNVYCYLGKEADPTDPDNGDDDTTPSKTTGKTTGKKVAPNTGDDSNLSLWVALLFISGVAAIGTAAARKKKKYTK